METASARRTRGRQTDHQIMLWRAACVLLSALSLLLLLLLLAVVSSGFGTAARLTPAAGEISVLVRTTSTSGGAIDDDVDPADAQHCGVVNDDDGSNRMVVDGGEWVRDDERYPLYSPWQCPFVDEGFRCRENGRPDDAYARWRWQPRHCTLSRFDAKNLLEVLRNRRLVFVGDSIGRNQGESMLCMLATAVAAGDKASIYEENGSPITKHKGVLSFRFRDYNCTVEHHRSPYLVRHGRPPRRAPKNVSSTLQLGAMDSRAHQWKGVIVFNTGHWWSHERLQQQPNLSW